MGEEIGREFEGVDWRDASAVFEFRFLNLLLLLFIFLFFVLYSISPLISFLSKKKIEQQVIYIIMLILQKWILERAQEQQQALLKIKKNQIILVKVKYTSLYLINISPLFIFFYSRNCLAGHQCP